MGESQEGRGIRLDGMSPLPAEDDRPAIHVEIGTELIGGPHHAYGRFRDLLQRGAIVLLVPSVEAAHLVLMDFASNGSAALAAQPEDGTSRVEDLSMDFKARRVVGKGRELRLSPSEYRILAVLVKGAGRAFSFAELGEGNQASAAVSNTDSLRSAVKRLRRKLGAAGLHVAIESVPGFGFRLVAGSIARIRG